MLADGLRFPIGALSDWNISEKLTYPERPRLLPRGFLYGPFRAKAELLLFGRGRAAALSGENL